MLKTGERTDPKRSEHKQTPGTPAQATGSKVVALKTAKQKADNNKAGSWNMSAYEALKVNYLDHEV